MCIRTSIPILTLAAFLTACGVPGGSSSSSAPSSSSLSSQSSSSSSSVASISNILIQENDSALCRYSGIVDTEHTGFTGSGFIDSLNEVGASIQFAVDAATAGNYEVTVRFANGGSAARGANLQSTELGNSVSLSFISSGVWTDWQEVSSVIYLAQGQNSLQLTATTADGLANIDSIRLSGGAELKAGDCSGSLGAAGDIYPAAGATNVSPDTRLRLTFDSKPSIRSGTVQIWDAANNSLVDTISVLSDTDKLGYAGQSSPRSLKVTPAEVIGNTISVSPHTNALRYGKTYYVVVNNGVFVGNQGGQAYTGHAKGQWQFTTKSSAPNSTTVTVDDDGPADFGSVQGALNYMMQKYSGGTSGVIKIKNGTYVEPLFLKGKDNLRLVGESRDGTVIQYNNYEALNSGSSGRPLFLIQSSDMISVENLTIFNTHRRSDASTGNQAETVYFNDNNGRFVAKNAAFISEQDTLLLKGYSWFYNSLVAGNVDYIWGYVRVALFENSEIRSLGDSRNSGSGGYILQARVTSTSYPGFIFLNSRLTYGPGPAGNSPPSGKTYLARSGYSSSSTNYDSFAFINCKMDSHIAAVGWFNENGKARNPNVGTATYGYREYGSTTMSGASINLGSRQGAHILSGSEYNQYYSTRAKIFASYNNGQGWNPSP